MKPLLSKIFVVGCLMAAVSFAWTIAEGQEGKKKKKGDPTTGLKKKLAAAELPADVLEKANKIVEEHGPKIAEAQAKVDEILTPDQRRAKRQAQKAAKEAGKKGKEAEADVAAAVTLTDEQKEKMAAAEKDVQAAREAMNAALREVLDDEQEAKVGIKGKKKRKKNN